MATRDVADLDQKIAEAEDNLHRSAAFGDKQAEWYWRGYKQAIEEALEWIGAPVDQCRSCGQKIKQTACDSICRCSFAGE